MTSEPPPRRPDEELRLTQDRDFGAMRLIRCWYVSKAQDESEWTESSVVSWEGGVAGAELLIHVASRGSWTPPDTLNIPAAARAIILRLAGDEARIRRDIASSMIDLAKDWAAGGDLPEPTVKSLAAALRLRCVSVYDADWGPTLWFEEPAGADGIFAGHEIEARFDAEGSIIEFGLAG